MWERLVPIPLFWNHTKILVCLYISTCNIVKSLKWKWKPFMCLSAFLQILSASNVDFKWAPLSSKLQTNLVESFGEIDQKCSILSKEFKTGTTEYKRFHSLLFTLLNVWCGTKNKILDKVVCLDIFVFQCEK